MGLLLHYLRQQRCLLILDNLESILLEGEQTGKMRPGYANYATLLQAVGSVHHQNVLLITTRELPKVLKETSRPSNTIRILALDGLDIAAGQAILQAHGLQTAPHEMDALVAHYSGNPLALQIAANTIVDLFGGDATAFRQWALQTS